MKHYLKIRISTHQMCLYYSQPILILWQEDQRLLHKRLFIYSPTSLAEREMSRKQSWSPGPRMLVPLNHLCW
jgi:hypothetical protein